MSYPSYRSKLSADELDTPSDSTDVSLALFRSFVRTVDRRSVSQAAKDLKLSQPTVSRHLSTLEQVYGVSLLVRSTRVLNTTAPGQLLYKHARAILGVEGSLIDDLGELQGELVGDLQVSAPRGLGALASLFSARFMRSHPRVSVALRLAALVGEEIAGSTDVAVLTSDPQGGIPRASPIGAMNDILVAAPELLCKFATPTHPDHLQRIPWLIRSGVDNPAAIQLRQRTHHSHSARFGVSPRMSTDQHDAHLSALRGGTGIGLVDAYAVQEDLRHGRLVQLLPMWEPESRPIYMQFADAQPRRLARLWSAGFIDYLGSVSTPGADPVTASDVPRLDLPVNAGAPWQRLVQQRGATSPTRTLRFVQAVNSAPTALWSSAALR